ncbi:MAG: glycosyltransferase family 4 protein [Vampirovibrionales bacterium]|nr:glycosyltransferase family 4 protein [Vampirovibrionales bacterium]
MPQKPHTIGMILEHGFPPDTRVAREATELVKAGHTVHLLCVANVVTDAPQEGWEGVRLHRLPVGFPDALKKPPLLQKLWHQWQWNQHTVDTDWQAVIAKFISAHSITALHVHDLRLAPSALAAAKATNTPVVVDYHEYYPALMQELKGRKNPSKGKVARQRWDAVEQDVSNRAHRIIVIDEASKARLTGMGIAAQKISVVPNVADVDALSNQPTEPHLPTYLASLWPQKTVLVYTGYVNHAGRGIQVMLEAISQLSPEQRDQLHFVVVGAERPDYQAQLNTLVSQWGLKNNVTFTGFTPEANFIAYINRATVCICPTLANDQTNSGIPNKVFLYAALGKPQLVSSSKPQAKFVTDNHCGWVFESGDPVSCRKALETILSQTESFGDLGANGRKAYEGQWSWQAVKPVLLNIYDSL